MLSKRLKGFSKELYKEGQAYLAHITHVSSNGGEHIFMVPGTRKYTVTIESQDEDLFASCNCFGFGEMDECKHVAACILYLDYSPLGKKMYEANYYIGTDFAGWGGEPVLIQRNPLDHLMRLAQPPHADSNGPIFPEARRTGQIVENWYEVYWNAYSRSSSEINLRFYRRALLKSGKMGKLKSQSLRLSDLDRITDKTDSEIFKNLIASLDFSQDYYSQPYFYSANLKDTDSRTLEKIIKTGRAFIFKRNLRNGTGDDIVPLEFDDDVLLEAKLITNMNEKWMCLGFSLGDKQLSQEEAKEVQLLGGMLLAHFRGKFYRVETFLSVEMLRTLLDEGVVNFTEEDLAKSKDIFLAKLDHRAIGGDSFGLEAKVVPATFEVHIKLPLGVDRIQARMVSQQTPPSPPFESLTVYSTEGYREAKAALESVTTDKLDPQGFFEIPVPLFQETINKALELNLSVKAEKAIIKTASSFNLSSSYGLNWFELSGAVTADGKDHSLPDILKRVKEGNSFVEFKKGELTYLPQAWLDKVKKVSEVAEFRDGKFVVHLSRAQQLESLEVPSIELGHFLKQIRDFKSIRPVCPSEKFKGELRDYQLFGLSWMGFLRELGLGGCLADDMGLGKTVQVAANLQLRKFEKNREQTVSLVVCPRSLVFNWFNELQRFTPDLKVKIYEGGHPEDAMSNCDVLISTYGLVQRHCEKLLGHEFDYIILDEAQAIKNPRSLTSKAIFTLKAAHRLALTGTPVENHVGEFYSIFNFLMPGAYKKEALNPGPKGHMLARALKPFVLRRTKQQVLNDLPEKVEQVLYCDPHIEERKHYDELKNFVQERLNKEVDLDEFKKSSFVVLEALTRLRQAACHPGLINPDLQKISSGKLEQLKIMLDEILEEGHKVIIFSQFTSLLKLVRENLGYSEENSVYLDGSSRNREGLVNDFKDSKEKNVFFVSIKAGGTGLNLTEASYCFLLDPWWNPAVEDQAIGRLHRIGQKKSVNVYRLITRNSIEEKVLQLQELKKDVIKDILDDNSEGFIRSLTSKELEFLLN